MELIPVIAYSVVSVTASGWPVSNPDVVLKINPFGGCGVMVYRSAAPPVVSTR